MCRLHASVDIGNNAGITPLSEAASFGHFDAVCCLINHGANVNEQSAKGVTPLINAAHHGHVEIAQILVAHGAQIEHVCGISPYTPLSVIILMFFKAISGSTPLTRAATYNHPEMVRALLAMGAKVDNPMANGQTALLLAAGHGCSEVVDVLLQAGADVNIKFLLHSAHSLSFHFPLLCLL
jgi:ankyrin repeat protein